MSAAAFHARLPRVAPPVAFLRNALLAALDGAELNGVAIEASAAESSLEGAWIVFDTEPGRVLLRLSGPDPLAAADALGRHEPLLAAIEAALGLELIPTAIVRHPAPDSVVIALVHNCTRAWLAAAPSLAITPPPSRRARAGLATIELPVAVRIGGAALGRADLAALTVGDMLLLPADAPATLSSASRTAHGRLSAAPAHLRVLSVGHPCLEISMPPEPELPSAAPPGAAFADHPIPITVELDAITIPLSTLSGLAPGSVLPLGATGTSLPVRLSVGGRAIATGELVAVGEGYGVLIERRQD